MLYPYFVPVLWAQVSVYIHSILNNTT